MGARRARSGGQSRSQGAGLHHVARGGRGAWGSLHAAGLGTALPRARPRRRRRVSAGVRPQVVPILPSGWDRGRAAPPGNLGSPELCTSSRPPRRGPLPGARRASQGCGGRAGDPEPGFAAAGAEGPLRGSQPASHSPVSRVQSPVSRNICHFSPPAPQHSPPRLDPRERRRPRLYGTPGENCASRRPGSVFSSAGARTAVSSAFLSLVPNRERSGPRVRAAERKVDAGEDPNMSSREPPGSGGPAPERLGGPRASGPQALGRDSGERWSQKSQLQSKYLESSHR